jgi:primary-amine oxidase
MASSGSARPHPLAPLSEAEFTRARDIIVKLHGPDTSLFFRSLYLNEPKKAELVPFLEQEHAGELTDASKRPARQALVEYDVVKPDMHEYIRAVVDVDSGEVASRESAGPRSQPYYTP